MKIICEKCNGEGKVTQHNAPRSLGMIKCPDCRGQRGREMTASDVPKHIKKQIINEHLLKYIKEGSEYE